jgi:hypothetical protein
MATEIPTRDVAQVITGVVQPYIGATMAQAAVQAHLAKLGVRGPSISLDQTAALIQRIGTGLNVFLGKERAAKVVDEMMRAVKSAGRVP